MSTNDEGQSVSPNDAKPIVSSSNPVKELKVAKLLGQMMDSNMKLYEQILDEPGFAFYFNELVKLAQK